MKYFFGSILKTLSAGSAASPSKIKITKKILKKLQKTKSLKYIFIKMQNQLKTLKANILFKGNLMENNVLISNLRKGKIWICLN